MLTEYKHREFNLSVFPMLQRVHLDIQVGEHTNNYPEIAAKDKLTELQLRVRQLLDQVEQIQKEQNYQRVSNRKPSPPSFIIYYLFIIIRYSCCPCPYTTVYCVLCLTVSRGAFSHDEREHQPACTLVVHYSDTHPYCHRHLADETPQELLWGQETGVISQWAVAPAGSNMNTSWLVVDAQTSRRRH